MINLEELNDMQREAAATIEGPVLILAGAGSGKTRTITYRIAHMVDNLCINPYSILGVSFTNKAATEMKERVVSLLGKEKSKGLTLTTFHALGVKILRNEIEKLGYHKNFSIYDTGDQLSIIKDALKNFHAEKASFDRKRILQKIGNLKNKGIDHENYASSIYFDGESAYDHATEYCYRFYQDKLNFFNAIDFDDILFLMVKLFDQFPEVAQQYSNQYKYLMIDEYQDTNHLQFKIATALTSTHNNICVVGDDDQSIYAFRGADLDNILSFEKKFNGCKTIKLEQNYRSTSNILELANKVIAENKNRKSKKLWSQKRSENKPILWAMGNTDHEAEIVVEEILQQQNKGNQLKDIAVLYRSKTQTPPLEDQLRLSQIPYTIIGGQKFYDKKEIKDLIAYLSVMLNINNEVSLRRIINVPHRGIGTATLNKFLGFSNEKNISLFRAMEINPDLAGTRSGKITNFINIVRDLQNKNKGSDLPTLINYLIEKVDYLSYVDHQYNDNPKHAESRKNDVLSMVSSAERFQNYHKEKVSLKDFLEKLLLQDSQDDQTDNDEIDKNEVTLMTLHSSKGLEFDIVYFVGLEEEILPHKRTISQGEDISEERRLCYVGITRARNELYMTYCKERKIFGKDIPRHKSRFINDVSNALYIEQDRTTFGHLSEDQVDKYKKDFFSGLIDSLN